MGLIDPVGKGQERVTARQSWIAALIRHWPQHVAGSTGQSPDHTANCVDRERPGRDTEGMEHRIGSFNAVDLLAHLLVKIPCLAVMFVR